MTKSTKVPLYIKLLEKYSGKKVSLIKENTEADKNQLIDYLQLALNNLDDLLNNLEKTTEILTNYYELDNMKKSIDGSVVVLTNIQTNLNQNITEITAG